MDMKRNLLIFPAVCALAVSSCTNDEVLSVAVVPDSPIVFDGFVNKDSRGVADITASNLASFQLYGYVSPSDDNTAVAMCFDNTTVTITGSSTSYSPTQYWAKDNHYWFCGYAASQPNAVKFTPASTSVWPEDGKALYGGSFTFNNGTAEYETLTGAAGDVDLVFAYNKFGEATDAKIANPVSLDFKHLLSKVAFKFTNNMPSGTIRIYNLKVESVDPVGTIDLDAATPAWELTTEDITKFDMEYSSDMNGISTDGIAAGANETTLYNIFIPGTFSYKVSFKIDLKKDAVTLATYTHSVEFATAPVMAIGTAYVFSATINTGNIDPAGALTPITFSSSVSSWTDDSSHALKH